jgi:tetratricopeptide (TPR) repeat protein
LVKELPSAAAWVRWLRLVSACAVCCEEVGVVHGGVFINYRGEDSYSYGALLHVELSRQVGPELVFLDSASIPAGADYVEHLLGRVRQARVVLAVIGTRWLAVAGPDGRRRIDDPDDWIRRELVAAFAAGARVIPVLTDGAGMPTEAELPGDLRALSRCQFRRLRHRDAAADVARLVADVAAVDPGLAAAVRRRRGVPRQLPVAPVSFTGRVRELDRLSQALTAVVDIPGDGGSAGVVVISAIAGTAGIGKTTLAVHWAHRVADRFPDGQLFVNLRGFDPGGTVMDPAEAVRGFLDALGVPAERIPVGLDAQAALYRSLLTGRRVLVVLDNARDPSQVRPLLPAAPGCRVLVTSRNQLSGLVAADGAHPVTLDLLSHEEAQELLARRLGPARVAAEPHAVEQIIARCARLPLALAVVAGRAVTHPNFPLATLAGELAETPDRLDALDGGDAATDVRAVFSWSYRALSPQAARLFRLMGLYPGPDISTPAAASLAGLPAPRLRPLLAELAWANLLGEHSPGRYAFHDLLRAYATEQTYRLDTDEQRDAATHRLLDHYLHTAHTADHLLSPTAGPITLSPPQPGTAPEHPADHRQALAWLTTEHANLLAAIDHAAAAGLDTHTWQLAWTLSEYFYRRGHWHDRLATHHTALAAARRLAEPTTQAAVHRLLARAHIQLGRIEDAHTHLRHALDLDRHTGHQTGHPHTHLGLAQAWGRQHRPTDGLHHARQALDLYRAAGRLAGQAKALGLIGWFHSMLGDHHQALTTCQQALTLYQHVGSDLDGQAETWETIGDAHHHLGHHTQAIACYHHALDLYRDCGNRHGEANTLHQLGDTHHATGNPKAAHKAWQHALTILDQFAHPHADQIRAKLHPTNQPPADLFS